MDRTSSIFGILASICIFLSPIDGFFSDNGAMTPTDYTIEGITREALLRASLAYFQNKGGASGDGPEPTTSGLSEAALFSWYYGDGVSPKKFVESVNMITDAAAYNCQRFFDTFLFINERITEGHDYLATIKTDIMTKLNGSSIDYDDQRNLVGLTACAMSSFYSNTNWVELFGATIYRDLGVPDVPIMTVAAHDLATCTSCASAGGSCPENLIDNGETLTSGYQWNKPKLSGNIGQGKCSHGGDIDFTRSLPAKGGMNKETSDPAQSPHHTLHATAGQAAIEALQAFLIDPLIGTYSAVPGHENFIKLRNLLQLGTGVNLIFVIDVTGSMADEIDAVKIETKKIANERALLVTRPELYMFVPFHDPEYGPVSITTGVGEFVDILDAIVVGGGGDCPEYAFHGLELAVDAAPVGSDVFMFTDASPKDEGDAYRVLYKARWKAVKIYFVLSGDCSDEVVRKRDVASDRYAPVAVQSGTDLHRFPRATVPSGTELYRIFAKSTGGAVFFATDTDIRQAVAVVDAITTGNTVTVIQITTGTAGETYQIPIDNTATSVIITVATTTDGLLDSTYTLTDTTDKTHTTTVDTGYVLIYRVETTSPGMWVFTVSPGAQAAEIVFSVTSPFDFLYRIFTETATSLVPLNGKPRIGSEVVLVVHPVGGDNVKSLDSVQLLFDSTATDFTVHGLTRVDDGQYRATITVPSRRFSVVLLATDTGGNSIMRHDTAIIEPESFWIELQNETVYVKPEEEVTVDFTFSNHGDEATFTFYATDNDILSTTVSPTSAEISPDSNLAGKIVITSHNNATVDFRLVTVVVEKSTTGPVNMSNTARMTVFLSDKPLTMPYAGEPIWTIEETSPSPSVTDPTVPLPTAGKGDGSAPAKSRADSMMPGIRALMYILIVFYAYLKL